jgi:glycosyltransferase involved in cell wall biosynthesis
MRILVISREIPPVGGGAGHVAIHLAECMSKRGHNIDIVTMAYGDLPVLERRDNITIHRVDCSRQNQDSSYTPEMLRFLFRATPLVRKLVQSKKIDLLHAHAIIPDGTIAVLGNKKQTIPTVYTAHGSDVPGYNPDKFKLGHILASPGWHWTLNKATRLVTPSNYLAELVRSKRGQQSIEVIPNGIDATLFQADSPKDNSFLIVSRLVKRKNFQLFLQALQYIEQPQKVHIVGDGPMRSELESLASRLENHSIVFHGWLENRGSEWKKLYESCRYFIFPSQNENFPINLLESMLAGQIVVASDIPGCREVLGNAGVLLPDLSVQAMVKTLQELLSGFGESHHLLSSQARQRVLSKFAWSAIADRYESLFYDCIQDVPPADFVGYEKEA